ncbi:class I SAM-dependent methyltransferase [Candidatus Woesearchaeota archaeon]|nr:class I SAM-dependent methyltransferase [Candidatus Woesearchaeota archaeon]
MKKTKDKKGHKKKLPFVAYNPKTHVLICKKKVNNRWAAIFNDPRKHDELVSYEDPKNKIVKEFQNIASFKDKVILDAGCGTGRHTFLYSKAARYVYALDPSRQHISFLKDKINKNKVKNIGPLLARIEKIPLKSNSVDLVVGTFSITSTSIDRKKAIKEILRVLKPKGRMIFADAYYKGEFMDIWRKCSDPDIAGGCYNCLLSTKDMYDFRIRVIETSWDFPTVKKAADLLGYVLGGKTKGYLLKSRKRRIRMKVFIVYGTK